MGLFNFVKEAGEKLFGAHDDDTSVAQKIEAAVKALNLGVQDLKVEKQGDKLTVNGQADSQEALEKAILATGNHFGIGQVESNLQIASNAGNQQTTTSTTPASAANANSAPNASQPQSPVFYTVKSGDTLSKISKEQYGDVNRYHEIFEANKPMLSSPDKIYPGQQLRIPQQGKTAAAA